MCITEKYVIMPIDADSDLVNKFKQLDKRKLHDANRHATPSHRF